MVTSGRYSVVNCGGNTSLIVNLLEKLYSTILPVIEDPPVHDADQDPNISPAYQAFFKDPSYASFVSTLFRNVTTGVPMTVPQTYSFGGSASFFCVTAKDQFSYRHNGVDRDAYTDDCSTTTVGHYRGFIPPQPWITLCPSFFTSNIVSVPPPNTCLTVNQSTNRFNGNGQNVWLFKMWILLENIVHYYLFTTKGTLAFTLVNRNDPNKCFGLGAEASSLNAFNYVYYAASLYGKCNAFPTSRTNGRILLEIDPTDSEPDVAISGVVTANDTDLVIAAGNATVTP